jgi:RluA family pseudouridine synthase
MILTARAGAEQGSLRLDDGARELFPQLSKGEIRRIIDLGGCAVNQVMVRVASRQLRPGDEITIGVMEEERFIDVRYSRTDLLYEDRSYLAVNKAPGINSQRTPYQFKGTVEYAVGQYLREQGSLEPARVIHRLDRGTSGTMFFPKTKAAATWISDRLKAGEVEKVYWAIVTDLPEEESWQVDAPIGKLNKFRYGVTVPGRASLTEFRVVASAGRNALIEARPKTGRTHQIRVHLTHCNLPILGDQPYGGTPATRMMLHCRRMTFLDQGDKTITACAPPDELFAGACADLGLALPA